MGVCCTGGSCIYELHGMGRIIGVGMGLTVECRRTPYFGWLVQVLPDFLPLIQSPRHDSEPMTHYRKWKILCTPPALSILMSNALIYLMTNTTYLHVLYSHLSNSKHAGTNQHGSRKSTGRGRSALDDPQRYTIVQIKKRMAFSPWGYTQKANKPPAWESLHVTGAP